MKALIERAHPMFRAIPGPLNAPLAGFSAAEIRMITETAYKDGRRVADLRVLGCPADIAARVLARHAAKCGIRHEMTDAERRAKAADFSAVIARDAQTEKEKHEQVTGWFDSL